ncbi:hypothetical protein V2G26_000908 [Clonostachys chloroleuca]
MQKADHFLIINGNTICPKCPDHEASQGLTRNDSIRKRLYFFDAPRGAPLLDPRASLQFAKSMNGPTTAAFYQIYQFRHLDQELPNNFCPKLCDSARSRGVLSVEG